MENVLEWIIWETEDTLNVENSDLEVDWGNKGEKHIKFSTK